MLSAPEDTEIHDLNPNFNVTQQHSLETCYLHLMKIDVETYYVPNPGLPLQQPNEARQTNTEKGKETRSSPSTTPRYTLDPSPERLSLALQTMDTQSSITMISPVENQPDITEATAIQESQVHDAGG